MAAAGGGVRPGPDSLPPFRLQRRTKHEGPVTLEKVLGVTIRGSGGLACDPATGLLAYPAGCVVVLLNPRENTQRHILNTSSVPSGAAQLFQKSHCFPAESLWLLRTHFQEILQLYDQVTPEATEDDILPARTAFIDFLGWIQAELRSCAVTRVTDAAIGPTDPQILMLLRTYSDSLVGMIRRRLEGSSAETL